MHKEIKASLARLSIKAKQKRRNTGRNILLVVFFALLFFWIPYSYPFLNALYVLEGFVVVIGFLYITFVAVPTLIQPLEAEYYALKRIAQAIGILEDLEDPMAYEEAYRDAKAAYEALNGIKLDESVAWYEPTNETFKTFLKNIKKIVLPAIKDRVIKKEHLEEMALAVDSLDITKVDAVNKALEDEATYKKSTVGVVTGKGIVHRFLRTQNVKKHGLFIVSIIVLCAALYYVAVNYLDVPKGYAWATSIGAGIALLVGMYFPRRPPKE